MELKDIIKKLLKSGDRISSQSTIIKPYIDEINTITSFLNKHPKKDFPEKIYCILNDIEDIQYCPCGKKQKFLPSVFRYRKYCNKSCKTKYSTSTDYESMMDIVKEHFENGIPINKEQFAEYHNLLNTKTSWMDENTNNLLRCYCLYHNIKEYPKCYCGHEIKDGFKNYNKGFNEFCSQSCVSKSNEITQKGIDTKTNSGYYKNVKSNRKNKIQVIINDINIIVPEKETFQNKIVDIVKYINFDIGNIENYLIKYEKDILKYIYNNFNGYSYSELIYLIYNGKENCYCLYCKNKNRNFISFQKGYNTFCCYKCSKEYYKRKNRYIILSNIIKICSKYDLQIYDYNNFILSGSIEIVCKEGHYYKKSLSNFYKDLNCPVCNNKKSHLETEICEFLNDRIDKFIVNDRKLIQPLELDIYLPDNKLAIEFNGMYWHCEANGKDKKYHLNKTNMCNNIDIQLLHIFENEWLHKKDIVKSVILSKLGMYDKRYFARKCNIKEIDSKTKNDFLEENHLQGKDKSSIKLGLFYSEKLLSVMTFGTRKITGGKSNFELIRYCNRLNTQVIGGASKLFKYFLRNYEYREIVTYADIRYSSGDFYDKLGFKLDHTSKPNYWYFKSPENKVYHRINFQKHKLKNVLENFDPSLTEYENMLNNGWNRIWDCGNYVYKYC